MDKSQGPVTFACVLRLLLICAPAPLAAAVSGSQDALLFAGCTSLLFSGLDFTRKKYRCLPFPIYLILAYAMQLSCVFLLPGGTLGQAGAATRALQKQEEMRTISVVMAAHNENKYMKRTLDSIYGATPPEILVEIIVVDDGSTPPLASVLTDFPQVKVIRHEDRRGLIKSKTEGGNAAVGDIIMFLDAHVKPEQDWYKAFLRHMNLNYKRVVVPLIPILDPETWQPNNNAVGVKMMFDWTLMFTWFEDHNDLVPCMSGGLFGITRKWWHESGEYDYGMRMWGGENIEQSIRIWLCGGEIYVARDSRIAHVFRAAFPYKINNTEIYLNKLRTVETWFDDYKENYYQADPAARQYLGSLGDISDRLALKERLHCKPFRDYIDRFKEVFRDKHMLPEEVFLIRDSRTNLCLETTKDGMHLTEATCDAELKRQQWSHKKALAGFRSVLVDRCLDANAAEQGRPGSLALLFHCMPDNEMQEWQLRAGHIIWKQSCLQEAVPPNPPKNAADDEQPMVLQACQGFLQKDGPFQRFEVRLQTLEEQQIAAAAAKHNMR